METDVLIIGTGFGGIGLAVRLLQAGRSRFVMLEKAADVGGVWRENTYPGAACDVPSHLYSFSFERQFDWSRTFAPQADILRYLRHCVDHYGLRPRIHTGKEVRSARYDRTSARWEVECHDGSHYRCRVLVAATGQLCRPLMPALPGLDQFTGVLFHSAQWRHDVDLAGKSVAVIGTGASAIQFVPTLARQAAKLTLFQRSPPWILPKPERLYTGAWGRLFRALPWLVTLHRLWIYIALEYRQPMLRGFRPWMALVERMFRQHLEEQVSDPDLRARLTPDYPLGCKRILISDDYYPALQQPNVTLVNEPVARLESDAIVSASGQRFPVDCVILGTGFDTTHFLAPIQVTGLHGQTLTDTWKNGAEAYLGLTVHGFPNLFLLYGPNTNLGHNSIVYMLESQFNYVLSALDALDHYPQPAAALNVRADIQQAFNQDLQQQLAKSVWSGGCRSWYVDAQGHNANNWPGFTFRYRALTRRLNPGDYEWVGG